MFYENFPFPLWRAIARVGDAIAAEVEYGWFSRIARMEELVRMLRSKPDVSKSMMAFLLFHI